jgi:hypothetical protein
MLWFVLLGSHVIREARLAYMLWFVLLGIHIIREASASCLCRPYGFACTQEGAGGPQEWGN